VSFGSVVFHCKSKNCLNRHRPEFIRILVVCSKVRTNCKLHMKFEYTEKVLRMSVSDCCLTPTQQFF
jgi:hypothetical protein